MSATFKVSTPTEKKNQDCLMEATVDTAEKTGLDSTLFIKLNLAELAVGFLAIRQN